MNKNFLNSQTKSISSASLILAISCYPNSVASPVASFAYVITAPQVQIVSGGGGGGGGYYAPQIVTGDINKDGKIDKYDFSMMMANWGKTDVGNPADLNGDHVVNKYDFALLMAVWGNNI